MGIRYPFETRWVRVRMSTHGYGYGYEFLPAALLLTGG
jgi:hypothetical protein